ncbi:MAG: FAD-dependent oxidoreductase [Clostridiales bacterium]|nr:FAD-dependent oxidoreductase [Clostridiales bacterium]
MSMVKTVSIPARDVPVRGSYDVIVAGGGVAGIAAALSARRAGAGKVLLIEREFTLGGLATLGLVTIFLPLCDGRGTQVSFGIAEELLRLSVSKGAEEPVPECWQNASDKAERAKHRYACRFNASLFACLAEELLLDAQVDILYGAQLCASVTDKERVRAVVCMDRSGELYAYESGGFVDASGDATLFRLSGAETAEYSLGNRQAAWYYSYENGRHVLHTLGSAPAPGEHVPGGFAGTDAGGLSRVMAAAHRLIKRDFLSGGELSDAHTLTVLPQIPQVRMSRRIAGKAALRLSDEFSSFTDSVGMVSNWRQAGPVYELPFGALRSDIENLFACGRIVSADDEMWDIIRVIPCCAVSGEAAGIAAAKGGDARTVQKELSRRGIPFHINQLCVR